MNNKQRNKLEADETITKTNETEQKGKGRRLDQLPKKLIVCSYIQEHMFGKKLHQAGSATEKEYNN